MLYTGKTAANAARKAFQATLGKSTISLSVEVPAEIAYRVGRATGPWTVETFRPADLSKAAQREAVKRGLTIYAQTSARPADPATAAKSIKRIEAGLAKIPAARQLELLAAAISESAGIPIEEARAMLAKGKAKADKAKADKASK